MRHPWRAALAAVLALGGACASEPRERGSTTTTTPASTTTVPASVTSPASATSAATTASTVTSGPPVALPTGPAWDRDFPDPFIVAAGDGHVAVGTTSALIQIQGLSATGLTGWAGPVEMLPGTPSWSTPWSMWAPALLAVDGGYLLYYTAQVAGSDQHCIAVARAPTAAGPFVEVHDRPLVCPSDAGGAIDPSPFRDTDGRLYLLWKNDGITLRRESAIWSQRLSSDGSEVAGDPVRLIGTDQDWEYPHVEAPSMAVVDGDYWLAYSGNWWNQDAYGIGMARCDSPAGPCEKPFAAPVLASAAGRFGPGGAEFFRDRSGRLLLAFHAWLDDPGYPGHRALFLATVRFAPDTVTVTPSDVSA